MKEKSKISHSRSNIIKQPFQTQIYQMKQNLFVPYQLKRCHSHNLEKNLICLNQKCSYYNRLICKDCQNCNHGIVNINKVVPQLCQWIYRESQQNQIENRKLQNQWRVVTANIQYCIDIFNQLLKIIQNHTDKKLYSPSHFIDISGIVYGMYKHDNNNSSAESLLKSLQHLQQKYHIFPQNKQRSNDQGHSWKNLTCQKLQKQKQSHLKCSILASKKSKQFSQTALAFSQSLSSLIQNKVKQQQTKNMLKQIKQKNQICLKDLMDKVNKQASTKLIELIEEPQQAQNIQVFSIELPTDKLKDITQEEIQSSLSNIAKLTNLKQLKINNKNGKIDHKTWFYILNYVEMLKFLKDLKLTLAIKDLQVLTKLFKSKQKSVRQIQSLSLQITDQFQLDLNSVLSFLNTLQLRRLNLILSRNNLCYKPVSQFLLKLRTHTSLSQLPLIQCTINLSVNKIHSDEKYLLDKLFNQKCNDVKVKMLVL